MKKNSIFLHVPKCAGMSMEEFCIDNDIRIAPLNRSEEWCEETNESTYCDRWVKANTYGIWNQEIRSANYFTFAFVRNPWDRMISAWNHKGAAGEYRFRELKVFLEFTFSSKPTLYSASHTYSYFHPLYRLFDENGEQSVDFIGYFERLDTDFKTVCEIIGSEKSALPHRNKSHHKGYTEYYDDEAIDMVAQHYSKDIEHFGYAYGEANSGFLNSRYPRLKKHDQP